MPEICRFLGIVISMYAEAGARHNVPHFHARYGEYQATFAIETGDLLAGSLPRSQVRLIQGWVELRRGELMDDWTLLKQGRAPHRVAPLT